MITVLQASPPGRAKLLCIVAACVGVGHAGLAMAQEKSVDDYRVCEMTCSHQPQGPRETDQLRRALDFERSENQRVADALIESGDALAEPRPIQHWAYFPTEEGRAQFIALIGQQFSGIDSHMNPISRGNEHAVTFWHTGVPDSDSMTEITGMLSLAAESCGGEYDGWETQVIR